MFWKSYWNFGIPVGTNLGVKADEFVLGPDFPLLVDDVRQEMTTPTLEFITPDNQLDLDKQIQDWFINEMGISNGLPAGAFAETEIANSGYAKMIDNLELIDLNEDDKDALLEFENKLFEMQKLVVSTEAKKNFGNKLDFEFTPIEFPKSDDEIWMNREKEFEYNISTPIDWLREYRPNAKDAELQTLLSENKDINAQFKGQGSQGIFDRLKQRIPTNGGAT